MVDFPYGTLSRISALSVVLCCIKGEQVSAEEYRHHAAKCLELAENSTDQGVRLRLIDMAHSWLCMSQQAEKNRRTDLVYEKPERPSLQPQESGAGA
jgi:hypothetical protein